MARSHLRGLRRLCMIALYEVRHRYWTRDTLFGLVGSAFVIYFFAAPVFAIDKKMGLYGVVSWVAFKALRIWRDNSPRNVELVKDGYRRRKLLLYSLIHKREQINAQAPANIANFRQEALTLIAEHVRHSRGDRKGVEIFANLLIADGNEMVVVARDRLHMNRTTPARSLKSCSLAWKALSSGVEQVTGDVYADYPETMPGKPYRSILVIPVKWRETLVGVVSVDSSRRYHFDGTFRELVRSLLPYVALLGWTLQAPVNILPPPP